MPKKLLTDRYVQSLKPGPRTVLIYDALVPGLGVLVTDKGNLSYVLYVRYPGGRGATRSSMGKVGAMSLADAREKARRWLEKIRAGVDPREEEKRAAEVETERRGTTVEAVMEDYLRLHIRGKRRAGAAEREIRKELLSRWAKLPITDVTRRDVLDMVDEIKGRGSPYQAHAMFGHARTFLGWCVDRGILDRSPCERMRPSRLIGPKKPRQRVLNELELAALWRAAGRMSYPMGAFYRLVLLTGCRRTELSGARWREFDLKNKLLTIPPERFKSDAVHLVPLSDDAMSILGTLPRLVGGDFVFSHAGGRKAVANFSLAKSELDRRMLQSLRALARLRGDDPNTVSLPPFVVHDLRRTMRTGLSALRVPEVVCELVIGHARQGLPGVYDRWGYLEERREALDLWAARLRTTGQIIPLRRVLVARDGPMAPAV